MQEKSENFNSLRPILFELCKKTTGGGQIDPPPSGNRVKGTVSEISSDPSYKDDSPDSHLLKPFLINNLEDIIVL